MTRGSESKKKGTETARKSRKKGGSGSGSTKLSKLMPRFIRLSAPDAAELGREVRGEGRLLGLEKRTNILLDYPRVWTLPRVCQWKGVRISQRMIRQAGKVGAFSVVLRPTCPLTHLRPTTPLVPRSTAQTLRPQKMYDLRPSLE